MNSKGRLNEKERWIDGVKWKQRKEGYGGVRTGGGNGGSMMKQ